MKIKNLTPHTVILHGGNNMPSDPVILVLEPESISARCVQVNKKVSNVYLGWNNFKGMEIDICQPQYGEIEGLPEPEDGIIYLVSSIVMLALGQSRIDVYGIGGQVRDTKGLVTHATHLTTNCHALDSKLPT